jgi:D-arabinose 1-dehydrogenase-like Zn-dependent alcohol dehydrogenase
VIDALPFDVIKQRCTMKRILVGRTGGPEVLEVVSAPPPSPGRGEVLVDVEAAGVKETLRNSRV